MKVDYQTDKRSNILLSVINERFCLKGVGLTILHS